MKKSNRLSIVLFIALFLSSMPGAFAQKTNGYHVATTFHIASTGGLDYIA